MNQAGPLVFNPGVAPALALGEGRLQRIADPTRRCRVGHEPVDDGLRMITGSLRISHYLLVLTQSGRIRTYAAGMVLGVILLFLSWLWS